MRKTVSKLFLLLLFTSTFFLYGCNNDDYRVTNEHNVINMFINYGTEDGLGNYFFKKEVKMSSSDLTYCFLYNSKYEIFTGNFISITTEKTLPFLNYVLYDYASITFSWNKFNDGVFYSYYDFNNVSRIDFEFSGITFTGYSLLDDYASYKIVNNTFKNLHEQSDIDEYASRCFFALQQVVPYCNSIFSEYNIKTTLW